jgi:hypothetical protein
MNTSRDLRFFRPSSAVILVALGVGFALGRINLHSAQAATEKPLGATTVPATQGNDEEPVPLDPLKLGYKTLRIANTLSARQVPIRLYMWANELAKFDQGRDANQLREDVRNDLRIGVYSLAVGSEGWGVTGLDENALRQVSTYYSTEPDEKLDPRAKQWLSKYPAYSDAELQKSTCEDPVCTFARKKTATK